MQYDYAQMISDRNLPHPEDLASENEYAFVGLYIRVALAHASTANAITRSITGNPEQDVHLTNMVAAFEQPLEDWLHRADEHLPEWFTPDDIFDWDRMFGVDRDSGSHK